MTEKPKRPRLLIGPLGRESENDKREREAREKATLDQLMKDALDG